MFGIHHRIYCLILISCMFASCSLEEPFDAITCADEQTQVSYIEYNDGVCLQEACTSSETCCGITDATIRNDIFLSFEYSSCKRNAPFSNCRKDDSGRRYCSICPDGELLCGGNCVNTEQAHIISCKNDTPVCRLGYADCNGTPDDGCEMNLIATHAATCTNKALTCEQGYADCNGTLDDGCETNLTALHAAACTDEALTCEQGYADCNGTPDDGCETNLTALHAATCTDETLTCEQGYADCNGMPDDGCEMNLTAIHVAACTDEALTCEQGYADCNGMPHDGCEMNLTVTHVETCTDEVLTCEQGYADCNGMPHDGCEMNLTVTHVETCTDKKLTCTLGYIDCNNSIDDGCEIFRFNDPNNCGECGHVCSGEEGNFCNYGTCVHANGCSEGELLCGEHCLSLRDDHIINCQPNALTCAKGYDNCNNDPADGCETNLMRTPNHCGSCGNTCGNNDSQEFACFNGECVLECPSGLTACGGMCIDAENLNVLSCENDQIVCRDGFGDCDHNPENGCEINTMNDNAHCGGCADNGGKVCTTSTTLDNMCIEGKCRGYCSKECITDENGNMFLKYCDESYNVMIQYCPSSTQFCGTINEEMDCYHLCETPNELYSVTYSDTKTLDSGKCLPGKDVFGNDQLGISIASGFCLEDDHGNAYSFSFYYNEYDHIMQNYMYCNVFGGNGCDSETGSCILPECDIPGGLCDEARAVNCIYDPARKKYVQTVENCKTKDLCNTYTKSSVQYAACSYRINGLADPISSLGQCTDNQLTLYIPADDLLIRQYTFDCEKECVTNADGYSYCKGGGA
ncbi:MAG: hypothetical protein IIY06_11365 [Proteobacteria bacterium]|nr:hypothetical protein [Pseudomonadota bacterium]